MIRIRISEEQRKEIEQIFIEDAWTAETGLFNMLKRNATRELLETEYPALYDYLYEGKTGKPNDFHVKALLLADRKALKGYIDKFGKIRHYKKLLNNVFRYDNYSKRDVVIKILRCMGISVCPYCNRQYIFTTTSGKVRAQLDHYYPKSLYPYLALSLYNMIPSCSVCNMAKQNLDTKVKPIMYPYTEDFEKTAKFKIEPEDTINYIKVLHDSIGDFSIKLDTEGAKNKTSIDDQMSLLHLDELYNMHTEYVRVLMKRHVLYSALRINELCRRFPKLFSQEEIKRTLVMGDASRENWGSQALSKLTYDIEEQLQKGPIEPKMQK